VAGDGPHSTPSLTDGAPSLSDATLNITITGTATVVDGFESFNL